MFCFSVFFFVFFLPLSLDLYFKIYAGSEQMEVLCSVFCPIFLIFENGTASFADAATKKVQCNEFFSSAEHENR